MKKLGEVLKAIRKEKKLTQQAVADFVETDTGNISRIERGQNATITMLDRIAKALDTPLTDILSQIELDTLLPPTKAERPTLPLLTLSSAADWPNHDSGRAMRYSLTLPGGDFAIVAKGDSMLNPAGIPSIPEGATVLISCRSEYPEGRIVAAKHIETGTVTLKRYIVDGPNKYLKPLNPDYRTIEMDDDYTIIGIATRVLYQV